MNKEELSAQTKIPSNDVDIILSELGISTDLPDYGDEQLKLIQSIKDIHKNEKAKSWPEAIAIYRKPLREAQLNEVAARHQIAPERIPEILKAMRLKPETLTDAQLAQFIDVCQKVQSGVELADAVPKPNGGRTKKASAPEGTPESGSESESQADNGATPDSAMALTSVNTLINLDVSEEDQATLRDVAEALGNDAVGDISEKMADIAHSVAVDIEVVARQLIMEAIFGKKSAIKPDPERALARLRQLKAQRGQK